MHSRSHGRGRYPVPASTYTRHSTYTAKGGTGIITAGTTPGCYAVATTGLHRALTWGNFRLFFLERRFWGFGWQFDSFRLWAYWSICSVSFYYI